MIQIVVISMLWIALFAYLIVSSVRNKRLAILKGRHILSSLRGEIGEMSTISAGTRAHILFYCLEKGRATLKDIGTTSQELSDLVCKEEARQLEKK